MTLAGQCVLGILGVPGRVPGMLLTHRSSFIIQESRYKIRNACSVNDHRGISRIFLFLWIKRGESLLDPEIGPGVALVPKALYLAIMTINREHWV